MNIVADYHTHTRYSHGKGSIEENVQAARNKGLKKIAITDHGFSHWGFGVSIKDIDKMRKEIDITRNKYPDIEVYLGIEANLTGLDGEIDIPEYNLKDFDIILMGFHKAVWPNSWKDGWHLFAKNALRRFNIFQDENLRMMNTKAIINAIERYPINIITHPGAKINIDSYLLAKAAAKKDVALEINASHGYMTVEYVKIALEEGASFVINSDAHAPDKVGVFDKAVNIANLAGVPPERIINTKEALDKG